MEVADHFDCGPCRFTGGRYWYSRYRGIPIKTTEHRVAWPAPFWLAYCGYIYIDSRMCDAETWAKLRDRGTLTNILDACVTWFELTTQIDARTNQPFERVEVGWDHSHSWDYERGSVSHAAPALACLSAIDKLAEVCPALKVWCSKDGSRKEIAQVVEGCKDWESFTTLAPTNQKDRHHEPARVTYREDA